MFGATEAHRRTPRPPYLMDAILAIATAVFACWVVLPDLAAHSRIVQIAGIVGFGIALFVLGHSIYRGLRKQQYGQSSVRNVSWYLMMGANTVMVFF